jgi:hypothetical protein
MQFFITHRYLFLCILMQNREKFLGTGGWLFVSCYWYPKCQMNNKFQIEIAGNEYLETGTQQPKACHQLN